MKELQTMTLEERVNVSIQCDSFFLDINTTKSATPVFNKLKKLLNLSKRYDNELWMFVTMIGKALKVGASGSQLSLTTDNYKTSNRIRTERGDKRKLNRNRAREVIEAFESNGLVEFYLGFKDTHLNLAAKTCIIFSSDLISMFPPSLIKTYKESISIDEMVEIRDSKKEKIIKLTRFKGVGGHRKFMFEYNSVLKKNDIRFKHSKCFVQYKQVFSESLDGAGRIYSFGSFQTMNAELRNLITINCESVTEVDLKANHISILYLLKGIVLEEDFDCYYIPLKEYKYKDIRNLCKMAIMCMINCSSFIGSVKALQNLVLKDSAKRESYLDMFEKEEEVFYIYVVDCLRKLHKNLNFYSKDCCWSRLQRLDSKICEHVLMHFTYKGEVVLGWHDSWIVRKSLQEELISVIKQSWYKVFGTYNNCFVKIEF